jgi:LemA protein
MQEEARTDRGLGLQPWLGIFSTMPTKRLVTLALVLGLAGAGLLSLRNALIDQDEGACGAWAQVESAYQRRFDLTPQLVEVVRAAAANEREVLREVVGARTRALSSQQAALGAIGGGDQKATAVLFAQASLALRSFLTVVVEAYPQVTATENFLTLLKQLEGSENRIHVARLRYNEGVAELNASVRKWGFLPFCGSVDERSLFNATTSADAAPDVDFAGDD